MLQHYTIPERHVIFSGRNKNRVKQKLNVMHGFMRIKSGKNEFYIVLISERKRIQRNRYYSTVKNHRHSWHGLTTPLCSNFLFANLFSMKFLYLFIISSLFRYFIFSCQYSYNLMLTSNCMCRPYIAGLNYRPSFCEILS